MKTKNKNILRSSVLKASLIAGALMLGVTGASAWTTSPMLWQGGAFGKKSCKEWFDSGSTTDGQYEIDPDGAGGNAPFNAYCDMTTDGGGWTLAFFLNTEDGSRREYDSTFWTSAGTTGTLNTTSQNDYFGPVGTSAMSVTNAMIKVYESSDITTATSSYRSWSDCSLGADTLKEKLDGTSEFKFCDTVGNSAFAAGYPMDDEIVRSVDDLWLRAKSGSDGFFRVSTADRGQNNAGAGFGTKETCSSKTFKTDVLYRGYDHDAPGHFGTDMSQSGSGHNSVSKTTYHVGFFVR